MKSILLSVGLAVISSLCGLAAVPSSGDLKGALCLTFDDHYLDSWCRELPRFERFGAHATFFISSSIRSADVKKMRRLQDAGHSLGLHGQTHGPALDVVARKGVDGFIAQEVVPQLQAVASAGLRVGSWAYPNSSRSDETDAALSKWFRRLRCGGVYRDTIAGDPLSGHDRVFVPLSRVGSQALLWSAPIPSTADGWEEDVRGAIQRAHDRDEALVFHAHNIRNDNVKDAHDISGAQLEQILQMAADIGVRVVGFDELDDKAGCPNGGSAETAVRDIDVGRQLFVDDCLVASTQGLVRVFNHPVKELDRPVLWPETDLEREIDPGHGCRFAPVAAAISGGLWWDPAKRVFRLWYEAGWMKHLCYAESKDGIRWERPDCGVVPGTNRVLPDVMLDSWSVFPDYAAENPYANWRLMVSLAGGVTDNRLFTSADGLHWKSVGEAGQSGDRTTMYYDPFRGKWVFSLRGCNVRNRWYWDSPTFGGESCHFSMPKSRKYAKCPPATLWLTTDERDANVWKFGTGRPQLYNMDAVAYESIILSVWEILNPHRKDNAGCAAAGLPKITELHFAYSRDGRTFARPDRTAAIPASGWGSGKWDTGYLSPVGGICVIRDERLWFYYSAMRGDATETTPRQKDPAVGWRRNGMHFNASVGVASLRRDGFVGLVADGCGELTTRPVRFTGGHLFVNAECRFGSVAAEVLDENGNPIEGFALADCTSVERRDETKAELKFRGDLAKLAGRAVRFRFKLHCGTLYSFWVSPSARGESRGYLAAGGPDYPGLRDL